MSRGVVVVSPSDTGIRQARAKTDRSTPGRSRGCLAAGSLDAVWMPDERTWVMRRRLARRGQLVRARTRAKNEIHAVLMRRLGRPPASATCSASRAAAGWPSSELPLEERETVDSASARSSSSTRRSSAVEQLIARRRAVLAGDQAVDERARRERDRRRDLPRRDRRHRRFKNPRKLVGYLGLDPRVRQSGAGPRDARPHLKARLASARGTRSSRRAGRRSASPGRLHAFYQRIRARRGHSGRDRRRRPQARLPVLVPAHPRARTTPTSSPH